MAVAAVAGSAMGQNAGPDVVVGAITDLRFLANVDGVNAYSIGADACNFGDTPVSWVGTTNEHPVIAQNIYRMKNGRFVHIGQGWVKHGHSSANANNCATCQQPPGGSSQLGVGCSDTYSANLNGWQILMGPRSQVNPTTGDFPYPPTAPDVTGPLDRRVQIAVSDIAASNNAGALYFAEVQYITADDARANNGRNNCSFQQITFADTASDPQQFGPTHQLQPAITAWQSLDPTVKISTSEYVDNSVGPDINARFWVGGKASDNGNGTWHYEYAIYNQNADRGAGSFTVPLSGVVHVTNTQFHAPLSHSGEPYSNAWWDATVSADGITFSTTPYSSDPNANAVRWGTLYNVRFDADTPPQFGTASLGLFKPGTPDALDVTDLPIPTPGVAPPPPCYANCDNSTEPPILNVADFTCFLSRFWAGDSYANCDGSSTPPVLNIMDFNCYLRRFAEGCP